MARQGICRVLISDNGPPFSSKEFKVFTQEWDIEHITSSPYLSRSNGLVERTVSTIKNLFIKCETDKSDLYLALLLYRNTPKQSQYSPAELCMSRKLRTVVPTVKENLLPKLCDMHKIKELNEKQKSYSKFYYNKHTKMLKPLHVGDKVLFKHKPEDKKWSPGIIIQVGPEPRSYIIKSELGQFRRNRQFILEQSTHTHHFTQNTTQSTPVNKNTFVKTQNDPLVHGNTRSRHICKPVHRYGIVTYT